MSSKPTIEHVSDTAVWVAAFRAQESKRADALFKDPLASVLVGERGLKLATSMPLKQMMSWVMVLRTLAIDRLIQHAISDGCDVVLNLGAGLDTRPYRMALPAQLRWIEIDFPHMVQLKNEKLIANTPVCQLERIAADLSDRSRRQQLFAQIGAGAKKAAVITEGVVPYLSNEEAAALASDIHDIGTFRFWIQDFHDGGFVRKMPGRLRKKLKNAPLRFDVKDWFGFFAQHGWTIHEKILLEDEARRINRPRPFIFPWSLVLWAFPKKERKWRGMAGYVSLKNSE